MGKKGFRDLIVWQKAKDLAITVYKITENSRVRKDHGLCDQIRRSAVSIASNLAEGDERDTDKEAVRFFYMAKGSLAELRTQLQIALETGQLSNEPYDLIEQDCARLRQMLGKLIRARSVSPASQRLVNPRL